MGLLEAQAPVSYRPSRLLSYTLLDNAVSYLDETLYSPALQILQSSLHASISNPDSQALVPPPQLLSLYSTLAVHPNHTTRTRDGEKQATADAAAFYIRDIIRTAGPIAARVQEAWRFRRDMEEARGPRRNTNKRQRSRRGAESTHDGGDASSPSDASRSESTSYPHTDAPLANRGSLFHKVDDFWTLFGWAMKCAVRFKGRWKRYKLLLSLMLEAAERDFELRVRLTEEHEKYDYTRERLMESMIVRWIGDVKSRTAKRRIVKEIFTSADSPSAGAAFDEIWKDETKPPKDEEADFDFARHRKRKKVDIDAGEFGEWGLVEDDDEDDDDVGAQSSSTSARKAARKSRSGARASQSAAKDTEQDEDDAPLSTLDAFGGIDALALRKRVLVLLATVAEHLPIGFARLEELLDVLTETLRPLPLPVFAFFVSRRGTRHEFSPEVQSALDTNLLRPLMADKAPPYRESLPSQEHLESRYLGAVASSATAAENAKVAVVVENMFRMCSAALKPTQSLRDAVRGGSKRRTDRAKRAKGKSAEEAEATRWIEGSEERIEATLAQLCGDEGAGTDG